MPTLVALQGARVRFRQLRKFYIPKLAGLGMRKETLNFFASRPLVAPEPHDVVCSLSYALLCDCLLAADGMRFPSVSRHSSSAGFF